MAGFVEQLKTQTAAIPVARRWMIGITVLLAGAGLFAFSYWQKEQGFRPLYSGLGAEDAGQIVQKLKETSTEYRLSENGSVVLAPASRIAELRLEMANAGLPHSGRIGFELFDKTNFGATDFAEHINYRRAVEGELERSVMTLSEVEQARVHVTFPKDSVFLDSRQPAKASVLIKLKPGVQLSPQNVVAITHLLSSAVEGLTPDQVAVLDMRGKLLSRPRSKAEADGSETNEMALEYQRRVERDLLQKINSTLEPLLGADKFRAGVSVECDFTSGEQSEETFDPDKSVMSSMQSTSDSSSLSAATGQPGVAANLPNSPNSSNAKAANGITRRTENTAYQTSRVVRHTRLAQGVIKNQSISVLFDQPVRWDLIGKQYQRVFIPPTPEKLKSIREVVMGVAGLKPDRGDQLIVESLPFESTLNSEPPPLPTPSGRGPTPSQDPVWMQVMKDPKYQAIAGCLTVVIGILVVVARRMLLRKKLKKQRSVAVQPALGANEGATVDQAALPSSEEQVRALGAGDEVTQLAAGPEPLEVLLEKLRGDAKTNGDLYAGILSDWLVE